MKALCAVGDMTFFWAWLGLDAQQLDIELGLFAGWGYPGTLPWNGGDPNFGETFGTRSVAFYGRVIAPIGS